MSKEKVFEDYFSELQTDMVSICLEYVKNQGDNIYIYCSNENNIYSVAYFYKINGKLKKRGKVNEELLGCDASGDMQKKVMDILMEDLKKIEEVCKEFDRPVPTEIKLVYDIKKNSLKTQYQYEPVYSNHPTKTARAVEIDWFNELNQSMTNMKTGFEDKFMELQSELISLCLEVTQKSANKIYAYASIEERSHTFNVFFEVNNEIKTLNQLAIDQKSRLQFLKLGTSDLIKIKELCKEYDHTPPTEIKMYYDVDTGEYNADYRYEEVCSGETGITAYDVFMDWVDEIKKSV